MVSAASRPAPASSSSRGRIVNVTSPAARIPWPGATAYTAARWAMRGFTEALQADLAGTLGGHHQRVVERAVIGEIGIVFDIVQVHAVAVHALHRHVVMRR